ncbi:hypothetical protein FOZ63_014724 [Perkinsus olseni]|nr:hypothetical protein FOZ63_014724 [Perkinsus olseni]
MKPFAYVFLFTSSLISAMAIHSTRTKTDHKDSKEPSEMPDPTGGSNMHADSDGCLVDDSHGGSLHMIHMKIGGYSVQYILHGSRSRKSVEYWMKPEGTAVLQYMRDNKGAKFEGPIEEINRKFFKFNPFANLGDIIVQKFEAGMNRTECSWLLNYIETNPAAGYEKWGRGWLRKFVESNRKEALKKLRKEGEVMFYDEEG